jgi:copper chaperone
MAQRVTMTFTVAGMHCPSCGLLIDDAVEDLDGVVRCETDSRRGRAVVVADPTVTTADDVVVAIATAGYWAEAVGS